jgi:hypothetical protein
MSINNKEVEHLPVTVVQLIETLEAIFPEESARLEWADREVWYKSGQRSVVNWLLELKRRDENPNTEEE